MSKKRYFHPELKEIISEHALKLLDVHCKIKPLRMDFYFKKHSELEIDALKTLSNDEINTLMDNLMQYDYMVGYAWVKEKNYESRIYYRAIIYIKGANSNKTDEVVNIMKRTWRDIVGRQCESYFRNESNSYPYRHSLKILNYRNNDKVQDFELVTEELATFKSNYIHWQEAHEVYIKPKRELRGRKRINGTLLNVISAFS